MAKKTTSKAVGNTGKTSATRRRRRGADDRELRDTGKAKRFVRSDDQGKFHKLAEQRRIDLPPRKTS